MLGSCEPVDIKNTWKGSRGFLEPVQGYENFEVSDKMSVLKEVLNRFNEIPDVAPVI